MDGAQKIYQESVKKLYDGTGNLVGRAEKIRVLGAKVKKKLPQALLDRISEEKAVE